MPAPGRRLIIRKGLSQILFHTQPRVIHQAEIELRLTHALPGQGDKDTLCQAILAIGKGPDGLDELAQIRLFLQPQVGQTFRLVEPRRSDHV